MEKNIANCDWSLESYERFASDLKLLSDERYRKFQSNLVPNIDNILGIRVPILRGIAKSISKGSWRDYFKVCRDDFYEETLLQGFVINNLKAETDEVMKFMDFFIEKIDNWATCDTFCFGMKIVKENREIFFPYIQKLLYSEKEFKVRTGLVLLLVYYIDDDYIDKIFDISSNVKIENYYVKMANAWMIACCFAKFKDKTIIFLNNNHLDDWTHNKAVQKIIESKTTSADEKKELKCFKR